MSTYAEKLRDPRWQRRRLEIMQRDGWACVFCGATDKTLAVHHFAYTGEPWEARDDDLATACEDCHRAEHEGRRCAEDLLIQACRHAHLSADAVEGIATAVGTYGRSREAAAALSVHLGHLLASPEAMEELRLHHEAHSQAMEEMLKAGCLDDRLPEALRG